MKLGDNFPNRITIRLSDRQFVFVQEICDSANLTPSEFVRMMIDSNMAKIRGAIYEDQKTD